MRVMIDPGHGGQDRGASYGGVEEAAVNWQVASELLRVLDALGWRGAYLSKAEHDSASLTERARMASTFNADLSLHIHCDARPGSNASGIATYHWPGNGCARALGEAITLTAPFELRGEHPKPPRSADKAVKWLSRVRNVLGKMPCASLLVEMGFLTNDQDRAALIDSRVQYCLASGMAAGLAQYALAIGRQPR